MTGLDTSSNLVFNLRYLMGKIKGLLTQMEDGVQTYKLGQPGEIDEEILQGAKELTTLVENISQELQQMNEVKSG